MRLARRHDGWRSQRIVVEIGVLEDVRVTDLDLRLQAGQPGDVVADPAARVMVLGGIPELTDPEIRTGRQHLWRGINRGRVEVNRLKDAAVGEVLGKRTRIWTGVEGQLPDHSNGSTKPSWLSMRGVR